MGNLMNDQSLIGNEKTVIEMIYNHISNLIRDQFDRPSNVHRKTGLTYFERSGEMVGRFFLNTKEYRSTNIKFLQRLIVLQHCGQCHQALSLLYTIYIYQ